MSLVPLKLRNIMVRRMGLAEAPVDEFVEALDEITEGMTPRAETNAAFERLRLETRSLILQATFFIIMVLLAIGGIVIGLHIASLVGS
jgi:hypothetical protein